MGAEIFRFEKNAYDPQEVIEAVRGCHYFHPDSTHGRDFFSQTVEKLYLNEDPNEVSSLVSVIMGGADSAMAGLKAYLLGDRQDLQP